MIQKSRETIKQDLLSNLDENWAGYSTGVVGKELIALATEILYQANITAEALTRPCDIDTASMAELYRLAAAEDIPVSSVAPSYAILTWPSDAVVKHSLEVQFTVGSNTYFNAEPCIPGRSVKFVAGRRKSVALAASSPVSTLWANVEATTITKVVSSVSDIDSAQQYLLVLGENVIVTPIFVYAKIDGVGKLTIPLKTFYNEMSDKPGYHIVVNKAGKTHIDLTELYNTYGTKVLNVQVTYIQGIESASKVEKDKVNVYEGSSKLYECTVEYAEQGSKDVENVRRQIRVKECLRQVLNNEDVISDYVSNASDINSCNVSYDSDGVCNVWIKPKSLVSGEPMEGGKVESFSTIQANLEYYGDHQCTYRCRSAYPIRFSVAIETALSSDDHAEVLSYIKELLDYSELTLQSVVNAGTISASIQANTGITCFVAVKLTETWSQVEVNGKLATAPIPGTVNLLDEDGNVIATDTKGQFPGSYVVESTTMKNPYDCAPNGLAVPTVATYVAMITNSNVCHPAWDSTTQFKGTFCALISPVNDYTEYDRDKGYNTKRSIVPNPWTGAPIIGDPSKYPNEENFIGIPELNKVVDLTTKSVLDTTYRDFLRSVTGIDGILSDANSDRNVLSPLEVFHSDEYVVARLSIPKIAGLAAENTPALFVWPSCAFNVSNPCTPMISIGPWYLVTNGQQPEDIKRALLTYHNNLFNFRGSTTDKTMETAKSDGDNIVPSPVWLSQSTLVPSTTVAGTAGIKNEIALLDSAFGTPRVWFDGLTLHVIISCFQMMNIPMLSNSYYDNRATYKSINTDYIRMKIFTGDTTSETISHWKARTVTQLPEVKFFNGVTYRNRVNMLFSGGTIYMYTTSGGTIGAAYIYSTDSLGSKLALSANTTQYRWYDYTGDGSLVEPSFLTVPQYRVFSSPGYTIYAVQTYIKNDESSVDFAANRIALPEVYYAIVSTAPTAGSRVTFNKVAISGYVVDDSELPTGFTRWGDAILSLAYAEDSKIVLNAYCTCYAEGDTVSVGYVRKTITVSIADSQGIEQVVNVIHVESEVTRTNQTLSVVEEGMYGSIDYTSGAIQVPSEVTHDKVVASVEYNAANVIKTDEKTYLYYEE